MPCLGVSLGGVFYGLLRLVVGCGGVWCGGLGCGLGSCLPDDLDAALFFIGRSRPDGMALNVDRFPDDGRASPLRGLSIRCR